MYTLFDSINYSQPYINYSPLTAGVASNPAVNIATMIRNAFLNAPMSWSWNRNEQTFATVAGTQDYTESWTDFGFIEKCSLTDSNSNVWEVRDVYNTNALGVSSFQQQPNAVSVLLNTFGSSQKFRFMGAPDAIYTVTMTYQKFSIPFAQFTLSAAGNASLGHTTYTGVFTPSYFITGANATVAGFSTAANNGTFPIVSCNATSLVLSNAGGVAESTAATVINSDWSPIPDSFSDVYNNLFLAEAFSVVDEENSAMRYRQRGIAALLSKAEGLTSTQINAFLAQFLARDSQTLANTLRVQQGNQARGI